MALIKKVNGIDVPMTAQEEADFLADQLATTLANNAENTTETNFKTALKNALSSINGKRYDAITASEVRLLVALLMHKQFGAINKTTLTYKNPNQIL